MTAMKFVNGVGGAFQIGRRLPGARSSLPESIQPNPPNITASPVQILNLVPSPPHIPTPPLLLRVAAEAVYVPGGYLADKVPGERCERLGVYAFVVAAPICRPTCSPLRPQRFGRVPSSYSPTSAKA